MSYETIGSCLLLLSILLLSTPVAAQQPLQRDPQAIAILQKSLAGGAAINDVTLTGRARRIAGSDDETGTAVLKALVTGETRMDLSFPSGQRSEVRAISQKRPVGHWSGPDGTPHDIPGHNLMVDSSWFFPGLLLRRLIGVATHGPADATSPAHTDRNGNPIIWCGVLGLCRGSNVGDHSRNESRGIETVADLDRMGDRVYNITDKAIRDAYSSVTGKTLSCH